MTIRYLFLIEKHPKKNYEDVNPQKNSAPRNISGSQVGFFRRFLQIRMVVNRSSEAYTNVNRIVIKQSDSLKFSGLQLCQVRNAPAREYVISW